MSDVFPDRSMEHRDKLAWMVETRGWAIEPVAPRPELEPPTPSYAYTIGLETLLGHAELVVCGLTPVAASGLLGLVVDLLDGGTEIPVGVEFVGLYDNDLRGAVLDVDIDQHAALFSSATEWYGHAAYRMQQIVWPDRSGWLPWEAGFDARVRPAQPLLGRPPP
jgi:hypothetical protein